MNRTILFCNELAILFLVSEIYDSSTGLAKILHLKNGIQLLQSPTFGLYKIHINKSELKTVPEDEENIEPIAGL